MKRYKKIVFSFAALIICVFILKGTTSVNAYSSAWYNQQGENLTSNSQDIIESVPDGANGTTVPNKRYAAYSINSTNDEEVTEDYIQTVKEDYYLNFYKVQVVFNNMRNTFEETGIDVGEYELDPNYDYSIEPEVNFGYLEMDTNIPNLDNESNSLECQLTYQIGLDDDAEETTWGSPITGDDIFQLEDGKLYIELDTSMDLVSKEYVRRITNIRIISNTYNIEYIFKTNILFQYNPYSTYKDSEMETYVKYTDTRSEDPITIDDWYKLFKNKSPRTIATFSMNDIKTGLPIENVSSIHASYNYQYEEIWHMPDFLHPTKVYYSDKENYEATVNDFLDQVRLNFNSENKEKNAWNQFWSSDGELSGFAGLVSDKYKLDTEENSASGFTPDYMWVWNNAKISDFKPIYCTQTIAPGVTSYHSFLTDGACIVNLLNADGDNEVVVVDASGAIRNDMEPLDAGNSAKIIYIATGKEVESVVDSEYTEDNYANTSDYSSSDFGWLNNLISTGTWIKSNFSNIASIFLALFGIIICAFIIAFPIKCTNSIIKFFK